MASSSTGASSTPSDPSHFAYSNAPYTDPAAAAAPAPCFPVPFHLQKPEASAQHPAEYLYQKPYSVPQFSQPAKGPQPLYPSVYVPPAPAPTPLPAGGVYSLPQYQQAQQLFQRDAQTITPEALESVKAALASSEVENKAETKKKAVPRKAAGQSWEDSTLADWPENDFRLFCGDLGNEVNDEVLSKAFSKFPSFNMARVVRDKRTGKTRGYGFVSFSNPSDLAQAIKELNGKYVGNRPIKLRKSNWKERTDQEALERQKHHSQKKPKLLKKGILHK
ncbi:RNA-binding protein 42 [Nymphaea thermarum]|nr:RNA-binding protein 42 [Nymphaea thermarum]